MNAQSGIKYGLAPGIRFACLLDAEGGSTELTEGRVWDWRSGEGLLWIHLERDDPESRRWLSTTSDLDPLVVEALLAEESRPRVENVGDALLVMLRGVNHLEREEPQDLVPIHLWIDKDRVISIRDKGRILWALRDIREALATGHGPSTAGALFVQIVEKVVRDLEPLIDGIEDDVDALDEKLSETPRADVRRRLSAIRRHATKLRRWIAPQRDALHRLHREGSACLSARETVRLREVADRLWRYIECLDAVRDRAAVLHDDLSSLASEQIGRNSYRLTAVAAVLLPPILITSTFGPNLSGLWGNHYEWALAIMIVAELLTIPVAYFALRRIGWL